MITEEHLNHWISEIRWSLNGIEKEIGEAKLKDKKGIKISVSPNINEDVFVSFEYLQEKATIIQGTLRCIEDDMKNE